MGAGTKPRSATGLEVIPKLLLALQPGSLFTWTLKYLKPLTQIIPPQKNPCSKSHSLSPNVNICFSSTEWSLKVKRVTRKHINAFRHTLFPFVHKRLLIRNNRIKVKYNEWPRTKYTQARPCTTWICCLFTLECFEGVSLSPNRMQRSDLMEPRCCSQPAC